jgi:hypothetical protein
MMSEKGSAAGNEVLKAIELTSDKVGEKYGLEAKRVRAVLHRTEYVTDQQVSTAKASQLDSFPWNISYAHADMCMEYFLSSFIRAIEYLHPEEVLTLFEKEDPHLLEKHDYNLGYLTARMTPLYDLMELENVTEMFVDHLQDNRTHIVETGLPRTSFERSPVLDKLLSHLYFIKKPVSYVGKKRHSWYKGNAKDRDFEISVESLSFLEDIGRYLHPPTSSGSIEFNDAGNIIYDFVWVQIDEENNLELFPYEKAPSLKILNREDSKKISKDRDKLFGLKIQVLNELFRSVRTNDVKNLWDNCLNVFTQSLSSDEIHFYINIDNLYKKSEMNLGDVYERWFRPSIGGITDLFEVIGHYEKELTIGTYAKTREALKEIIAPEDIDRGFVKKDESLYFKYVSLGKKDSLDDALDLFSSLQAQEDEFWKEYRYRVRGYLENIYPTHVAEEGVKYKAELGPTPRFEASKRVIYETTVAAEHAEMFELNLHHFAEFYKWHIANTGKPPEPPPLKLIATTPIAENGFHKDGEIWEIIFQGKSISFRETKGLRYITFLISHPRKEYHVLDLVSEVDGIPAESVDRASEKRTAKELADEKSAGDHDHSLPPDENVDVILDAQAQENIKKELDWLERELEEAAQNNDLERASHLREEKENILEHLSKASGSFGRSRKFSDEGEKARKRVAAAIRRTLEAIEKENTDLWRHLKSCIKTGYSCSYEPLEDIEWSL